MNKTIGATLTAIGLALATAACQDPHPAAPRSAPVSSAQITPAPGSAQAPSTKRSPDSPVSSQEPTADAPATAGHGFCVDANNGVVDRAIQSLGPAVGGQPYLYTNATNAHLGSCPQLLWVQAETPHGTGSSPSHVLFFNHDGYLGTATAKATPFTQVSGSSDRAVEVSYRWLEPGEPNCCPSGAATITFALGSDGKTVTPSPDIPKEVANP